VLKHEAVDCTIRRHVMNIIIASYIVVAAWKRLRGKDTGRFMELVPNQRLKATERDGDCFRLRQGWVQLRFGTYYVQSLTHAVKIRATGTKGWFFLTPDCGRSRLRIYAARFTEEDARGLITDILPDNPEWDMKAVAMPSNPKPGRHEGEKPTW
jgi:hypothetical protein